MNKRIKELRKHTKLTQTEFGEKIGRSLKAVQYYENGQRGLDDSLIFLICKTFNVNETWLREGIGAIFSEDRHFSVDTLTETQKRIIDEIRAMTDEEIKSLSAFIEGLKILRKQTAADNKKAI